MDKYSTVLHTVEFTYEEKRSAFIGVAAPVSNEDETMTLLKKLRSEHKEARHICYACRYRDGSSRSSDDGEPSGTAGKPILSVITGNELFDTAVAVVRYFGGTLLGTGGLARAYTSAASGAVTTAGTATMHSAVNFEISFAYPVYDSFIRIISQLSGDVISSDFGDAVTASVSLKEVEFPQFCTLFREVVRGDLDIKNISKAYRAFPL